MEDLKAEVDNITVLSWLGKNKALSLLEKLNISVEDKAEIGSMMVLFETIEKKGRRIFDFPGGERHLLTL